MNLRDPLIAQVDDEGRLVLPTAVTAGLGLAPGSAVSLDLVENGYRLHRPVEHLAKVYVEPTSRCNLTCRTCIRNAWEEPMGDMSDETFAHVLEGLRAFDPPPAVFFGGFGEPLAHPSTVGMVARVKALGSPKVGLITNGCLLNERVSAGLIEAGLDDLWVSLDGIRPESYGDVRLDAWLGIAFVAMRRNIADLPKLWAAGRDLGATQFLVSNVIPYTKDLVPEILYPDLLGMGPVPTLWHDSVRMPVMQVNETTSRVLAGALSWYDWQFGGTDVSGVTRSCPFIEAGTTSIGWDGKVSPCLALVHSHTKFFSDQERKITRHVVGDLRDRGLPEIWADPGYVDFRRRVQEFDFPPCVACGGCNLFETNQDDCEDDVSPRCGACLWAHGLIRCP